MKVPPFLEGEDLGNYFATPGNFDMGSNTKLRGNLSARKTKLTSFGGRNKTSTANLSPHTLHMCSCTTCWRPHTEAVLTSLARSAPAAWPRSAWPPPGPASSTPTRRAEQSGLNNQGSNIRDRVIRSRTPVIELSGTKKLGSKQGSNIHSRVAV